MKLIGCNGVAWMYGRLKAGSICHRYMDILLYVKLIGCNGVAWIYGQLEQGALVYMHSAICETSVV